MDFLNDKVLNKATADAIHKNAPVNWDAVCMEYISKAASALGQKMNLAEIKALIPGFREMYSKKTGKQVERLKTQDLLETVRPASAQPSTDVPARWLGRKVFLKYDSNLPRVQYTVAELRVEQDDKVGQLWRAYIVNRGIGITGTWRKLDELEMQ